MLNPAYKLTIGSKVIDTTDKPQASTVIELSVSLDLETPADRFLLKMGNVGAFRPAREDETKIELGYADNGGLTQVVVGTVETVEPGLTTTHVRGYGGAIKLLRTFVDQTYERQTAGAIVRDLADKSGIEVETADDGINFPAYVVDGRRSVYLHFSDIAELCGFDLYFNPDGKLVFEKFLSGKTVHVFEAGKHIVALDVLRTPPLAEQVEMWGESATGSDGADASAWVTTDFSGSKGTAGSGVRLLIERPAVRTADAARTAANAFLTTLQRRTIRGRLVTIGRPEVKLGDSIRMQGLEDDSLNDRFQVRSVVHRITKSAGFTTTINFRAIQT